MPFHNPWIDPRITQIRSAEAQIYLKRHGWQSMPSDREALLAFERPGEEAPVVRLPLLEEASDYTQRMIELISGIAQSEKRYAVEVLNEMLQLREEAGLPQTNGAQLSPRTGVGVR